LPTLSPAVVRVAWPDPFNEPVPNVVTPSLKVTVPVGVPAPAATVAVNVTDCPKTDGFTVEASVVVVLANGAVLTVWINAVEALALKSTLPAYSTVSKWEPTIKAAVENVACPEPSSAPVPTVAAPSLKVTVPLRVPAPGAVAVTIAVKVTDWPDVDGFTEELSVAVVLALFTVWPPDKVPVPVLKSASPS